MTKVIALLCADIHLSHTPPVARSAEPDWYAAQGRYLNQLGELAKEHGASILCAGDLLETWRSPPELINWAIEHLPHMYAVPGQHDLPHHNLDEIRKSAYWTLVEAKIENIPWGDKFIMWARVPGLVLYGFPWEKQIRPIESYRGNVLRIAVAHRYVCIPSTQHPGATKESQVTSLGKLLQGYDVAVFGDNHKPFDAKVGDCQVFNCGCLIPRSMDEKHIKPSVGLLYDDGHIERHNLDVSEDKWLDDVVAKEVMDEFEVLGELLTELRGLDSTSLDFRKVVMRFLDDNRVNEETRKILIETMEGE